MPTITVNKDDLIKLIGKNYTLEEFDALLTYVKGEFKGYSIETNEIKIELNDTNRPDLWSPEGIARQLRYRFENISYESLIKISESFVDKTIFVDNNVKNIRPYIGSFIARGVPVSEQFLVQMIQTQEKICEIYGKKRELIAIGIYNLEAIKFPLYYKAVYPNSIKFVPLGFETEMDLNEILVKHPKGLEFSYILREKGLYPILVDHNSDVLSFPPIINSRKSGEVAVNNQNLFIEVTGLDIGMTLHSLNILAFNFKDRGFKIAPIKSIYSFETDYGKEIISPYPLTNEVEVNISMFNKYLGNLYSIDSIKNYLIHYGLKVNEKKDRNTLVVSTYPYRQDYMHEVDAVEDLAISIGIDNFEPIMPERFTIGKLSPMTIFEDKVRDVMIGFSFEEIISNILTNKKDYQGKANYMFKNVVEIQNIMSESYSVLRNSVIPSILKVEAKSFKSLYPHKVFEVGEVVKKDKAENHGCRTKTKLVALLSHPEANFSEMGSYFENLSYQMFWDTSIRTKDYPIFIKGRSGEIMVDNKRVGIIGEIHPEVLENMEIKMPTVVFEIDLTDLFSLYFH